MKVSELIEILKLMPQDAEVYRVNEQYAYGYTDEDVWITEVVKDDEYSVTIK